MGSFHDLPKDVIWLILRQVLRDVILEINTGFSLWPFLVFNLSFQILDRK